MSKVALITGASSGIGLFTAKILSQNGFTVCVTTREPKSLDGHGDFFVYKMDITNFDDIKRVVDEITGAHKRIDVLINNAGYGYVSSVEESSEQEMLRQFDVNVFGVLRVCKAVIPVMRGQNKGVIINVSSFLGKVGLPLLTFYNAGKYAVEGITDSLRHELRNFNIRVHSLMPGFFNTKFARENLAVNQKIFDPLSPYKKIVSSLIPIILEEINGGNHPQEAARVILEIINDDNFAARATAGDKAKKFIPMKKELCDEDFERKVREYYNIG